jgi:RNA polymerase sigma factor (TIGR02999 family)
VDSQSSETTQLLLAWADGDANALRALTPRVYRELRRMAAGFMKREGGGQTLQATDLVHEVYLRLVDVQNVPLRGKSHFYAMCARMMRRILVDAARKRATGKHGGGLNRIGLEEGLHITQSWTQSQTRSVDKELIVLNDALNELAEADPRKARVVELRYFGGLSVMETAAVLKVSEETITRDWRIARGWLLSEMSRT